MEEIQLKAQSRSFTGKKVKKIRESGQLPVILYGHGVEPKPLAIDIKEFAQVFSKSGSSTLVKVYIDSAKEPVNILFHQIDRDPVTDKIIHADLLQVKLTEKIHAEIPIEVVGAEDSPVVKEKEGSIITNKDHIEVEAFPQDLVSAITVDVSQFSEFDQVVHVKDLSIPDKIEVLDDPEELVVMVQEPRSEEELAKLEEEVKEDVEAVEVEKKGKEEEEGAEGAEDEAKPESAAGEEKAETSEKD